MIGNNHGLAFFVKMFFLKHFLFYQRTQTKDKALKTRHYSSHYFQFPCFGNRCKEIEHPHYFRNQNANYTKNSKRNQGSRNNTQRNRRQAFFGSVFYKKTKQYRV